MYQVTCGDGYFTPEGIKRSFFEYLLLGTRWSPYLSFFQIMFRNRALVVAGLYDDEAWSKSSIEVLRAMERCGARFQISGLDYVRRLESPAVFISNHMSTLETLILPGLITPIRLFTIIVKSKLMTGPVWGPVMKSRNPIVVGRVDPRADLETVLTDGVRRLREGRSVLAFPQGTRTEVFDASSFNSLGVKLAAKAAVPVVPIAVKTDYWGNSPVFKGFGPVRRDRPVCIKFGEPVAVEGRGKTAHAKVVSFIVENLRAWGAPVASAGGAVDGE
jgi:1-acyl-sn-glycerol-3-phosphate acyltransferase